jgi:hypothetical protein
MTERFYLTPALSVTVTVLGVIVFALERVYAKIESSVIDQV